MGIPVPVDGRLNDKRETSEEGSAILVTPTATRVAQAGRAGTDGLPNDSSTRLQGPVALELLHSDEGSRATVLALYRSLSSDWMFQVLKMTPSKTRTVLEIRLRAPFDLSGHLRLQPGVRWVRQQSISKHMGKAIILAGLDEASLPEVESTPGTSGGARVPGPSLDRASRTGAVRRACRDHVTLHIRETPASPGASRLLRELRTHPRLRLLSVASRKGHTTISLSMKEPLELAALLSSMEGVREVTEGRGRRHVSAASEFDVLLG